MKLIPESLRRLSRIEWLILAGIVAVLIALLLPALQWASSGDIELPVRVLVFDARSGSPIAGARVGLLRAAPWFDDEYAEHYRDYVAPDVFDGIKEENQGFTNSGGQIVIVYKFRTSASHNRPTPHAHTTWVWAAVQADGFGGALVQLRQESMPTRQLREQQELRIPIGLMQEEKD